jgi:hypothetical protein
LPPPTAELIILRVAISSFLATASEKRGEAFLRHMAATMVDEESLSTVSPIRGPASAKDVARARREAAAMFTALLPTFRAYLRR